MRASLVAIFCTALIAVSSIQAAAAAKRHAERHHVRKTIRAAPTYEQSRDPTAQADTSPKCAPGTSWVCTNLGCWCN
jgi:hypothetical protein